MKKRRWNIILLTLILAAVTVLLPVAAMAIGNEFTTESGFNCNVNENDGTVTITGYVDEKYTGGDLEIPEVVYQGNLQYTVTQIGKYAFQNKGFLNGRLILPKTLIYIETNAFSNCSGLKGDLTIPDSVVSIGEGAFYDCTGFKGELKLGSGLKEIGAGAFHRCCFTGSLEIPSSVSYIGNAAFFQCSGFTGDLSLTGNNMKIGGNDSVQDADCLDKSVFYQCEGLSGTLTIGEGVTYLYGRAFYDLPNINRVVNNSDKEIDLSMLDTRVTDNNDSPWTNKATGKRITRIGNGIAVRDPVVAFVIRLYQVCLDRKPDAGGLNNWVDQLKAKTITGVQAASGFIFSQEFKNKNFCNTCFVKQLYQAFMGREYDQGGLNNWVKQLESGKKREEVFNGFALSAEFNNLCGQYGITRGNGIGIPRYGTVPKGACSSCGEIDGVTAFVTRLYQVCLDRAPDAGGLADWTNQLWDHRRTGKSAAFGFVFSAEFQNKKHSNSKFVDYMYSAFFGREPDAGGKANWVRQLNAGKSREAVFNGFADSAEFSNLCARYGITAR